MRERFAAYGRAQPRLPARPAGERPPGDRRPGTLSLRRQGRCASTAAKASFAADDPPTFVAAFTRLRRILVGDGYPLDRTEILVEDYLPGGEVALEGLLTDGQLHVLALFRQARPAGRPRSSRRRST